MYRFKQIIYLFIVVLIILVAIAFSTLINNNSLRNNNSANDDVNTSRSVSDADSDASNGDYMKRVMAANQGSATIKVSPETRDFIQPSEDPLNSVASDDGHYETPRIPNVSKRSVSYKKQTPVVSDYDPFNIEQKNEEKTEVSKSTPKDSSDYFDYKLFLTQDRIAADFDIMNKFSIGDIEFFVIGYRPASIQRDGGFVNRKYYIFKNKNNILVKCFDLFERQNRDNVGKSGIITVSLGSEDVNITFQGPNSVSRSVYKSQLLSSYSENNDIKLILKKK